MKLLFLRGQVPKDRDPSQIMFKNIDECDDMWTQLCHAMIKRVGHGEIWYWGGKRKVRYSEYFIERWIPNFSVIKHDFSPDIIFARGGFKDYNCVLERNKRSFKIYYGAGKRFYPQKAYDKYDLILVDTKDQLSIVRKLFPAIKSDLLIKPVAENIFKPVVSDKKEYDIILVGNYNRGVNKGHDFAFNTISKKYKILCVGIVPKNIRKKYPHVYFTGWLPRKELPKLYAKSKVAVICCGTRDSCPRVIPEAIACDIPIVVLNRINFNKDLYITNKTGKSTSKEDFNDNIEFMMKNYNLFSPYQYYIENISINKSIDRIFANISI